MRSSIAVKPTCEVVLIGIICPPLSSLIIGVSLAGSTTRISARKALTVLSDSSNDKEYISKSHVFNNFFRNAWLVWLCCRCLGNDEVK
jgi:hypothetical protein